MSSERCWFNSQSGLLNPETAPYVLVGTLHGSHCHQCMNVCMNYCKSPCAYTIFSHYNYVLFVLLHPKSSWPSVSVSQNPRLLDDVSFHPCVRFKRWEAERILSFIPPDGNFRLLSYHVSSQKSVNFIQDHFMSLTQMQMQYYPCVLYPVCTNIVCSAIILDCYNRIKKHFCECLLV